MTISSRNIGLFFGILHVLCFATYGRTQSGNNEIRTIVIDAGHGGPKPGAVGKFYLEKDIALGVALRLGRLIEERYPDIQVIYTRKNDYDVDLVERSNIANRANADLFVSIHCNGSEDHSVTGNETWVAGVSKSKESLEAAIRENSAIETEGDFDSKYEDFDPGSLDWYIVAGLMQNAYLEQSLIFASYIQEEMQSGPIQIDRGVKQAEFVVLYKTAAPSVLIELGYITNVAEELIMADPDNQELIAERILAAFGRYKEETEKRVEIEKQELDHTDYLQ